MEIRTLGVVGCGQMGAGIAQVAAQAGCDVLVCEVGDELLQKGLGRIASLLAKDVERGKLDAAERDATLARLKGTTELADLRGCELVVEAIVERIEAKRELFAQLDTICPPETIFASNTSSLTIVEMAAATQRPDRFAGLHFFNPVPLMKLVEVVRAIGTSDTTIATLRAFGERLGKTVVEAKDTPGFIVNRLLLPYLLDAIRIYEEGRATAEDIDTGMRLGCNHPMGPLALCDYIGLDTMLHIAESMFDEYREPRFAAPVLLRRMVQAGMYGRKNGKGFYQY
jgi:3-hydroxybutyryl-CoA dehydrogenase